MLVTYVPELEALFSWGDGENLELVGEAASVELWTPAGRQAVSGQKHPLRETATRLAVLSAAEVARLSPCLGVWTLASKLALELVAKERVAPSIVRSKGRVEARWAAALAGNDDAVRVALLAKSMPPAAHAVPTSAGSAREVWAPEALLRAYLNAVVDALVRHAGAAPTLPKPARIRAEAQPSEWRERWQTALNGAEPRFVADEFAERGVLDELSRWSEPVLGEADRLRTCLRLELPAADGEPFVLRFLLQSPDDLSLFLSAEQMWASGGRELAKFGRAFRDPENSLLEALGRAARLFAPVGEALSSSRPESVELDATSAFAFLERAGMLSDAGFNVIVPAELTKSGQRRLRLRMRVGGKKAKVAGVVSGAAGLGLDELLQVDWQAVIGDEPLSLGELSALARQKAPLVQFRGAWVAVDPRELDEIQKRISEGPRTLALREAVQLSLAGEAREGKLDIAVIASASFGELLARLKDAGNSAASAPKALNASLRPYQLRGLHWLSTLAGLGFGACLADDMGLGKTIQLLAFLLQRLEAEPRDQRPALLVAPTSVVGNWERELARFAPSLRLFPHYGAERGRTPSDFPKQAGTLVVTSYGLLRRDAQLLARVEWSLVALDEAQNIKNSASATALAARSLQASHRFALTGTPVENRLAELWSILEFANPGMLGGLEKFRREFALPIERYGDDVAAERLRRVVAPFVLRRTKSDPSVISDLPAKNEMKVVCTLTREQATLYKAVVDAEMRRIDSSEGIERKGRVLALLSFTKQICNHPAQYLGEQGPLPKRSGKLTRLGEMLEEALAAGDKALIFTQFREMGDKLVSYLQATLGEEVLFLHGGSGKKQRDEMVQRFQSEANGPRLFVLSLKAGGSGLNLTAANHVFHYDRWWNPAVEDQATDRAYRIGQKRAVQVHKLTCAGTVEDKVDQLLEQKRALASKVIAGGERWLTELANNELRELFALSDGALSELSDGEAEAEPAAPKKKRSKAGEVRP